MHRGSLLRPPNVRIAVTGYLLNQMVPDRKPEYQWVRDSVMGHPVRGHSLTSAHVSLVLISDPDRLRGAERRGARRCVDCVDRRPGHVLQ